MDNSPAPRVPAQNDTPGDDVITFHIDNGSTGSPAMRLARAQHRTHLAKLQSLGDPTALDPADLDNPAVFEPMDPATLDHYTGDQAINPPSARVNAETAPSLATPDLVAALVGMDDDATDRLIADIRAEAPRSLRATAAELATRVGSIAQTLGDHADQLDETDPDRTIYLDGPHASQTVLPQYQVIHDHAARLRTTAADLRRLAVRLLAAGLAVLVCGGLAVSTAPKAEAAAYPLAAIRIVLAGPVASITVPAVSTSTTHGRHVVTLSAPQDGHASLIVAAGTSTGPLVTIAGRQMASALKPGTQTWQLWDAGDGSTRPVQVTVLRQSRVSLDQPVAFPGGLVVSGRASHFDAITGTYRGDVASVVTVTLRSLATGRATRIDAPTSADGSFVTVPTGLAAGGYSVTAVRLVGATVTGGSSVARVVVALPLAPARG